MGFLADYIINGKKYIGQKSYHKSDWKTYLGSGIHLKRAIDKYGKENFSREIIEECPTKEELDKREIYWISFYNAVESDSFYNIANGGDGGNTIAGYSDEELEKYKEKKRKIHSLTSVKGEDCASSKLTEQDVKEIIQLLMTSSYYLRDIADKYKVSPETIDAILNHKCWRHLTNDIIFPKQKRDNRRVLRKSVNQFDINGNLLHKYDSARDAENNTGISFKQISQGCKGDKKVVHGFVWRFDGDSFDKYSIENNKTQNKPIPVTLN